MRREIMNQRSANDEDVLTCPWCNSREHLIVKWKDEDGKIVSDWAMVGCERCNKFASGEQWKYAYINWNIMAYEGMKGADQEVKHLELYKMLKRANDKELELKAINDEINEYLKRVILPECPFETNDIIRNNEHPQGLWEILSIEPVYGINTGPFCIMKAIEVTENGRYGNRTHEFLSNRLQAVEKHDKFFPATKWSMLVAGDECTFNSAEALIDKVDYAKKCVVIKSGKQVFHVKRLSGISVQKCRL